MTTTETDIATRLGFQAGMAVMEIGWGEDSDDELRKAIETAVGGDLVDEDHIAGYGEARLFTRAFVATVQRLSGLGPPGPRLSRGGTHERRRGVRRRPGPGRAASCDGRGADEQRWPEGEAASGPHGAPGTGVRRWASGRPSARWSPSGGPGRRRDAAGAVDGHRPRSACARRAASPLRRLPPPQKLGLTSIEGDPWRCPTRTYPHQTGWGSGLALCRTSWHGCGSLARSRRGTSSHARR